MRRSPSRPTVRRGMMIPTMALLLGIIFLAIGVTLIISALFPRWFSGWGTFGTPAPAGQTSFAQLRPIQLGVFFILFGGMRLASIYHSQLEKYFWLLFIFILCVRAAPNLLGPKGPLPPPNAWDKICAAFLLLFCGLWSCVTLMFVVGWVTRGVFTFNGTPFHRADNPASFWLGISASIGVCVFAIGFGLRNFRKNFRGVPQNN